MAKLSAAFFLLALLVLSTIQTMVMATYGDGGIQYDPKRYGPGSVPKSQCPKQCKRRCSKTKHHAPWCRSFCVKCCNTCLCVPPGFWGNKQVCACYNNWKTQEGRPKCP